MLTNASLRYHFHPKKGWMNDPNGLCFFGGYYHAFFQHAPDFENPWHQPMAWGHARTKDFLHWEELSVAISAGDTYDAGGVWSGTAIERDGMLWAYYASVDGDGRQTVSLARSADGEHFVKYEGNPIIADYPIDCGRDFRDPAVFEEDGRYYLVMASADVPRGKGVLLLYKSDDGIKWDYQGVMTEYDECKYCECPSLVKAEGGYILSVSVVKKSGEHWFEVLYGDFDGKKFTPKIVSRFQKGPDEYAGQIFRAPDGRDILISWVSGWDYQDREKCIGCLSLPLEVKAEGGVIKAYPVAEVRHLLDEDDTLTDSYVRERFVNGGEEVYIEIVE